MTDPRHKRLSNKEFAVLRYLARRGGGRPITLPIDLRLAASELWRSDLVEIWYRQTSAERPAPREQYFSLSTVGWKLASSLPDRNRESAPAVIPARKPKRPTMKIRNFDPRQPGQAFQGDVPLIPIPLDLTVAMIDEIEPREGRLILQEGEATGHHHHIYLLANIPKFHDEALARDLLNVGKTATAKLYRDPTVAPEMVRRGILTRSDLATACLVVEGGPVVVAHQEHSGIRVQPGKYLIGRQVESAGAEERVVRD